MPCPKQLFSAANEAFSYAYAPYSGFSVGAAVLADNGQIYSGCNVENISYPCGTCAEAGAIAAMVAGGGKRIREIIIIADGSELIAPCGACLQRIKEFADNQTLIHLADRSAVRQTFTIAQLLPHAFAEKDLIK